MKQFLILTVTVILFGCGNQNKVESAKKEVGTIELVIFKTKPEFTQKEVIAAASAVSPVVEKLEGYLGRKLAMGEDGTWTDIVYWTDLASAEKAAQEVMKSETCQKFFGMIDERSMKFMHLQQVLSH